eukprot:TRINITY_DN22334_c0_g1_i3.p1 TRINITY_DN22334_c0_g1~~TRINITY_DN22334_c0_g1_i3.p1  ORF type:complete len:354 (+),score=26.56 TRINITY_DN22334_c0_g1_i3:172-1233(+)
MRLLPLLLPTLVSAAQCSHGNCDALGDPNANHYDLAVSLDQAGDYPGSLAAFRAAYKYNPSPFNQVNVGVSLMRFAIRGEGQHHLGEALELLFQAQKSGLAHAVSNWKNLLETCRLMRYAVPTKYHPKPDIKYQRKDLLHQRDVPPAPPLPRVALSELTSDQNGVYLERRKPFVLTGAMAGWRALNWSLIELGSRWPKAVADFHPFNMLEKESKSLYLTRFSAGLKQLTKDKTNFDGSGRGPQGRYLHLQLTPSMWGEVEEQGEVPQARHWQLHGDEWMNTCLEPELQEEYHIKTHWKILIMGTRGAGMFNHTDSLRTSSWHGQLTGRKWWYLCKAGVCYETIAQPGLSLIHI